MVSKRAMTLALSLALVIVGYSGTAQAGPDVTVLYLAQGGTDINEYISGSIRAYAWGTTSCNPGNATLRWYDWNGAGSPGDEFHPVIAQNMYRLKNGRFEQIGMGWLKHGFCAVNEPGCGTCQDTNCDTLGIQCADTYWAGLNESGLKPRWPVNASTGVFPFPEPQNPVGDAAIRGRVQVQDADIAPAQNPGALYFIEGHYITQDDSESGTLPVNGHNAWNNASWRRINAANPSALSSIGLTVLHEPAIFAWVDFQPTVKYSKATVDGTFHIGYDVTDNGNGTWHYEVAVFNMDSHRSAQSLTISIPQTVTVTNIGFKDINYHSGEPVDNVDWTATLDSCGLTWATQTWSAGNDTSANALRWSTMYNFRFDADSNQVADQATLGLFRPGTPSSVDIGLFAPEAVYELGDPDHNGLHDLADFAAMQNCFPTGGAIAPECRTFDYDCSNDVDLADFDVFAGELGG